VLEISGLNFRGAMGEMRGFFAALRMTSKKREPPILGGFGDAGGRS
jgi:hypothetical protein